MLNFDKKYGESICRKLKNFNSNEKYIDFSTYRSLKDTLSQEHTQLFKYKYLLTRNIYNKINKPLKMKVKFWASLFASEFIVTETRQYKNLLHYLIDSNRLTKYGISLEEFCYIWVKTKDKNFKKSEKQSFYDAYDADYSDLSKKDARFLELASLYSPYFSSGDNLVEFIEFVSTFEQRMKLDCLIVQVEPGRHQAKRVNKI